MLFSAALSQPQTGAQHTLPCQLSTQQAPTIPFLIFPLSHFQAHKMHSALSKERLWLLNGGGEPGRWWPLLPRRQRQETEPLAAGRWWGHQPRVRGQRDRAALPGADVLPWPAPRVHQCVPRAVPKPSSKKCEEAKGGKWWYIRDMAGTKPNRCQDAGEEVACCGHQESNYRACLARVGSNLLQVEKNLGTPRLYGF